MTHTPQRWQAGIGRMAAAAPLLVVHPFGSKDCSLSNAVVQGLAPSPRTTEPRTSRTACLSDVPSELSSDEGAQNQRIKPWNFDGPGVFSAGTITEVSPGILVIEQPGASAIPVRYVNDKTTNYVDESGQPVSPESVKSGTPVRVFYTKVGDTLVASKVEVQRGGPGLPKPPVESENTTTTKVEIKR